MFKVLLLTSLAITCVIADTCNYVCVAENGNCNPTTTTTSIPICPVTQICNYTSFTCYNAVALGGACTDSSDCANNANGVQCFKNTCQMSTSTAELGQACNTLANCDENLYCFDLICAALPTKGQSCSAGGQGCAGSSVCNGGTCITGYSLAVGASCDNDDACAGGLYCSSTNSTCKAVFPSSNKPCNFSNPSVCNTDEACNCATYSASSSVCTAPTSISASDASNLNAYLDCQLQNNCGSFPEKSCKPCNKQMCALLAFVKNEYEGISSIPACLGGGQYTTLVSQLEAVCNSASRLIFTGIFLVVVVLMM